MSEGNQLEFRGVVVRATFGRSRFGPGPKRPLRGVRPFDSSGRESLKNLLGLRLECRATVAMIAFRP